LKITILGTAYPMRGGIAHYVALLYEHLKKKHEVNVISFSLQYPKILFPGKTQEEQGEETIKVTGTPLMNTINPFSWIKTAMYIISSKPDVLIFKYWMPFFAPCYGTITLITKLFNKNIKVFYICDNLIPHEKRFGDSLLTKYAFMTVDAGIVQSDSVERDFVSLFPKKKFINSPHPVYTIFGNKIEKDITKKELGITDEKVILFFGYIRAYKGLDILIEAMPEILKRVNLRLIVVGEPYEKDDKYFNLVEKLGLKNNVTLKTDYVPNDEVGKYFSVSDVVVLPYRSATQSGIIQIAYNFDKPVIATNVGGLAEVVKNGETGFIVEPNNSKKIAEAVIKFYNEGYESIFVNNVIQEKKKYSWDTMVTNIEKLYYNITKE
jgi:glycosyltransferase involved in cell wall biosynthesis